MHKIGILSDTHGRLRPEVRKVLAECEMILHAGDLDEMRVLSELREIAPVFAVRGNADEKWGEAIPRVLEKDVFGVRIVMAHKKKDLPPGRTADLVICGHTHRYADKIEKGVRMLNPGSCGKGRPGGTVSMAVLEITEGVSFEIRRIDLSKNLQEAAAEGIPAGLGEILPAIMRDIDKGRSIEVLSKKYHISEELSENICRMYLTHQNIDVEGILRRLGL